MIEAIFGIAGILLGGGLQAWHQTRAQKAEAWAVLNALVADVESLSRLVGHRGYLDSLIHTAEHCRGLIAAGQGTELIPGARMTMQHDYLALYSSLSSKIGYLTAYQADRIVRFYALLKGGTEALLSEDPGYGPMDAETRLQLVESDIEIIRTALLLGAEIASFRAIAPPPGGGFWQLEGQEDAPRLPTDPQSNG